ncbi:MAG TPA: DNA-processing protein DprA [Vicinamibacterales bacterium]|jgi:DNA processing protein|nr:DNA-processing protein DprA [Vicinamibacterales bacterium]
MTLNHAIALSLVDDLSRVGLTERLTSEDPELLELASRRLAEAQCLREQAAARGIGALAWNDALYPAALLTTTDCPPLLWYRGDVAALNAPAVAIVGSRAASAVALETALRIASDLAAHGIVVVSGLARGVDSAAHRGALQHGRTAAVLGSGLDCIYPHEHVGLADAIAAEGIVLSEYPPQTVPLPFRFPLRNRIISGLSRAVVVIEASDKSGSLITAGCALDQGREVMVVPGNVLSGRNRGGHALLRDGAHLVETADDILSELHLIEPGSSQTNSVESAISDDPLLDKMEAGHPYDLDALAAAAGLDLPRLLPRLSQLELKGLLRRVEGGRFIRSARTC